MIDSFEYNGDTVYLYSTSDIYNYSFDIFRKKGDRLSRATPTIIKQKRNSPFGEHINISFFIQVISNTPYDNLNPEDVVLVTMDLSDPETDTDDAVYYYDNINYVYTDKYNECSAEIMEKLKSRIASASWTPSGRKRS